MYLGGRKIEISALEWKHMGLKIYQYSPIETRAKIKLG